MSAWLLATALAVMTATPSKPTRVLVVLTSHEQLGDTGRKTGVYLSELTHAVDVFSRAGWELDFVSPRGGRPPLDAVKRDDALNRAFLDDPKWMKRLDTTMTPDKLDVSRYDVVYIPGGHGTMFDLPDAATLSAHIGAMYSQGAIVSAVCHGPAALVNVKLPSGAYLVAGKDVTGFTTEEETAVKLTDAMPFLLESKLVERGARFSKAPKFQKHVVRSERLITGQNPASATEVANEVVRVVRERSGEATKPPR
jgi:putative intracellular protease/amidase